MLAMVALVWGGVRAIIRQGDRKRGMLMLAAAFVLLANVLLYALPV